METCLKGVVLLGRLAERLVGRVGPRRRECQERGRGDPHRIGHKRNKCGKYFGCDHTSTNAPDPIRTPQLSVLGRE